jgi:hypothetical protein
VTRREIKKRLADLEDETDDEVGWGEALEYGEHVREHAADAESPEEFFGPQTDLSTWEDAVPELEAIDAELAEKIRAVCVVKFCDRPHR